VIGWDRSRGLLVDYLGNSDGPLEACTLIPLDEETVRWAIETNQQVVLLFEAAQPNVPMVSGFVQPWGQSQRLDKRLREERELYMNGRRVEIQGSDEIVLRCGEASITLRRNGRVVVRGTWVETRSKGINRIRGGSVLVN